ncbi:MAG: hypothetical protein EOO39_00580 [Cytophagaceae bacterium]|nr:MAG: hypothetical protein EOO39_00580 [Cytophagaceae bacterium]
MKTKQILLKNGKALLKIVYGLDDHNGKRSNAYFSITGYYGESRSGRLRDGDYFVSEKTGKKFPIDECGCIHDRIIKACPSMQPLIDLHLCYADGKPMHHIENPTYWFATGDFATATNQLRIPDDIIDFVMADVVIARAATGIRLHNEPQNPTDRDYMFEIRPVVEKWAKFMEPIWLHQAEQAIAQFDLRDPSSPSLS